jgi:hypothetical protein
VNKKMAIRIPGEIALAFVFLIGLALGYYLKGV